MSRKDSPCVDCCDRYVGCHADCEEYKEFRQRCDTVRQRRMEDSLDKSDYINYKKKQIERRRKGYR